MKQIGTKGKNVQPEPFAVGFVLVNVAPTHEEEVHTKLSQVPEIQELYALFGEYDLIAKIEAKDFEKLGHIIVNELRCIEGVIDTRTLTATKILVDRREKK